MVKRYSTNNQSYNLNNNSLSKWSFKNKNSFSFFNKDSSYKSSLSNWSFDDKSKSSFLYELIRFFR